MEVSGKKLQPGRSNGDRTYCQHCIQDGETVPAEAFCTVCKEVLCSTCINAHRKLNITKTHALLNKSEMPTSLDMPEYDDECTEPCDVHPKELIKYFCRNHRSLNCGHCVVQNHRSCIVDVIADISEAFKDGQGYGDNIKTIVEVFQAINDYAYNVQNNIRLVAEMGEREVSKLRQYRDEIMEVPGKKLQRKASSVDRTFCQPCSQDGDTLPAEAYCNVCKEFLCTTCVNAHRKLKITKGHALLDKSKMPTSVSDQEDEDDCTEPCDIHPKEFIKYFCSDHQTLNCGHCLATEHRSCHVGVISDVAKSFKEGPEYDDITKTIPKILQEITDYSYDVEKNIKLVLKTGENEFARIRIYREEVNKYFEEQESLLLKIIDQMKNMDETLLDSLRLKSEGLKSKLQEVAAHIEAQKNNTQLFIEAKRAKKQLESMKNALADLIKENKIHHYEFRKDTFTEKLLTSSTGLGTVESIVSPETISSGISLVIYFKYEAAFFAQTAQF
ncbi:transcription intermediary factor 1-beta-like [Mya arenaria]|uniref:transcription intermediary factor 1-beta-like n=1 Tax=Mya arenaria TaxID=6604 RepID=UPI0022E3B7C8|nr:transcription intermediary factor 1-beta-like [Mya arenaria]